MGVEQISTSKSPFKDLSKDGLISKAKFTWVPSSKKGNETLSETQYDLRKIEPVTMKANFIHFWCAESKFMVKK